MPTINFAGLASGIDTNALIDAQSEATRQQRIAPKQDKVAELEDANAAFSTLKNRLGDLRTTLQQFTTLNGGGISKLASSSDEGSISATASNGAANGTYTISSITSLARNHVFSFNNTYPSSGSAINASISNGAPAADRQVAIDVGSGPSETVTMTLTSSTTLDEFVTQFNSSSTLATASVINVGTSGSPSYKLFITSNKTGIEEGTLAVSTGIQVGSLGGNTSVAATDAQFTLSGVSGTIKRSTNAIGDLLPGVTFELLATTSTPATITVSNDPSRTLSRVQDFVEAYNSIVNFIRQNNSITREENGQDTANIFAPLARTRTDDGALQALRQDLAGASTTGGTTVNVMADLGITTERDGTIAFNSDAFKTALATDSISVDSILKDFADTVAKTGGTVDNYVRFNGMIDISVNSNTSQINSLNRQISDIEALIARQEEQSRVRFARLESLMGDLQSQQSQLTSALSSLG